VRQGGHWETDTLIFRRIKASLHSITGTVTHPSAFKAAAESINNRSNTGLYCQN
jgi:hypothetical protein